MKKTIIILAFILGFMFCSTYRHEDLVEGFSTNDCPNLLIKRGKELYLLNKIHYYVNTLCKYIM